MALQRSFHRVSVQGAYASGTVAICCSGLVDVLAGGLVINARKHDAVATHALVGESPPGGLRGGHRHGTGARSSG